MCFLGVSAVTRGDEAEGFRWMKRAYDSGRAEGPSCLAMAYSEGWGVEKDINRVAELYAEGASKGDSHAKAMLGQLYVSGEGVDQDYEIALRLFQEAAEAGNDVGQFQLGAAYMLGQIVEADVRLGSRWLLRAAEQGNPRAQALVAGNFTRDDKGVLRDPSEAYKWTLLAAAGSFRLESLERLVFESVDRQAMLKGQEMADAWIMRHPEDRLRHSWIAINAELVDAAKSGDLAGLGSALQFGAYPNWIDETGFTALKWVLPLVTRKKTSDGPPWRPFSPQAVG